MHPTDKKKIIYSIIIILLVILTSIICLFINTMFLFMYLIIMIIMLDTGKLASKRNMTVSISLIFTNLITILLAFLSYAFFSWKLIAGNAAVGLGGAVIMFSLFYLFWKRLSDNKVLAVVLEFIQNEKDSYDKVSSFPALICKKHLSRTAFRKILTFKNVHCRIDKGCTINDIVKAKKLIGLIGKNTEPYIANNNYYVAIWDEMTNEVLQGDYDIIEIHEHKSFEDYDKVITKVISYFYNEINRFKPISEVEIRVVGHPNISENTKRLLEQNFLKVEYASD